MTVTRETIAIPDSTEPTISLLRELRRDQVKKRAVNAAYWVYLVALVAGLYGGTQIAAAFRALRRPPPPTAQTPLALHAAPYALTVVALVVLLALLRDALWRGPVTLPQVTVDWLLGTPVDRGRLLRPRFRISAVLTVAAGAVVGIVPAAALIAFGLSGRGAGSALRVTGLAMASVALLFALGTGCAGLIERHPAAGRWLRRVTPAAIAAAAAIAGLAAWAALGRPPAALAAVVLWSGPWGWAAQGMTGLAGGAGAASPAPLWPFAILLLGAAAVVAVAAAHRGAAGVPGAALRARARTLGAMSAAVLSMDTRGVANAYASASRRGLARLRLRPPRRRELVLPWRDLLALARTPSRLAGAAALALLGVGLIAAVARRGGSVSLLPVACALALGYLAAAWLCEGARLDAEDTRRSENLPLRFSALAWWHAVVPCAVLLVVAGLPVVAAVAVTGDPRFLVLLAVAVPVLVAGALVNVFRGEFAPDMFAGVDTPGGNTAAYRILFWYAWGPLLAVAPMALLLSSAIGAARPGTVARAVVIGAALAVALLAYAARRAARLRAA
ncbi:MAG TPA: hypothetical protein VHY31_15730 [Streptosporangiaceae bacterium]|nr:hypothetical protein [Streptosporangiaceae bacterium]